MPKESLLDILLNMPQPDSQQLFGDMLEIL
jgi:hypothetical protein